MKTVIACVLSALLMFQSVFVYASDFSVNSISVENSTGQTSVTGAIPEVTGLANPGFQARLNESILKTVNDKVAAAVKNDASEVSFAYDVKTEGSFTSVLIYIKTMYSSVAEEVVSFNFDCNYCEMKDLTDILGVNAVSLVNRTVMDAIKKEPEVYSSDFKGIELPANFYVYNGDCVILFDKYKIAAGYVGIVEITLKLSGLKNYNAYRRDYLVLEDYYNLKMLPLRAVCEGLGYTVRWNGGAITINNGNFNTTVTPGKNSYAVGSNPNKELESAPLVKDGITYAPISFFETALGAVYSIDDNETITFTKYWHR